MVHSSTLTITADDEHLTRGCFSLDKTVRFGNLEFIADYFGSLSLSPKGNNSGTIFVGTTRNRSPSLCTILEDSADEFYTTSSKEGSFILPVTTAPRLGSALIPQAIVTVLSRTIELRLDTKLRATQRQGKQAVPVAQLAAPRHHETTLRAEKVLTVDLAIAQARVKGIAPTVSREGRKRPSFTRASQNVDAVAELLDTLLTPSADEVDRV
jgi:hypothetical protein